MTDNPRRPPKKWMRDCIRGVSARGGVRDPAAVCGALWYHKASPKAKRAALRREHKSTSLRDNPTAGWGWGAVFG